MRNELNRGDRVEGHEREQEERREAVMWRRGWTEVFSDESWRGKWFQDPGCEQGEGSADEKDAVSDGVCVCVCVCVCVGGGGGVARSWGLEV